MLGFLLMVAGGFLLIYGAMESYGYSEFESLGLFLFVAGLTIGVIGVIVPEKMIRSAWIVMGIAFFSIVVLLVLTAVVAYTMAWVQGYSIEIDFLAVSKFFSMFFLLTTIVAFIILVLIKRR